MSVFMESRYADYVGSRASARAALWALLVLFLGPFFLILFTTGDLGEAIFLSIVSVMTIGLVCVMFIAMFAFSYTDEEHARYTAYEKEMKLEKAKLKDKA